MAARRIRVQVDADKAVLVDAAVDLGEAVRRRDAALCGSIATPMKFFGNSEQTRWISSLQALAQASLVAASPRWWPMPAARGTDLTIFSPRAAGMGHHLGDAATSEAWASACNELIHRVCTLFPRNFAGVGMLPQTAGVSPRNCIAELERCVLEYGFVGCNLNPDPSGGYWKDPPLGDRYWYPLYEKMVELDVPAMIHVSASCNPAFHTTASHYLNGDTAAFMQCLTSDLFKNFPTLKFIIPHGGGAVPYHWGRFRGIAQDMEAAAAHRASAEQRVLRHLRLSPAGSGLLTKVIPLDNILFASEMIGAVRGIDPETGHHYDDTKRYIEQLPRRPGDKAKLYEGNARRVYGRLSAQLTRQFGQ